MAGKRKTNTRSRAASVKLKPRRRKSAARSQVVSKTVGRFVLPLVISIVLLGVLVVLGMSGYRTATASSFFDIRNVAVSGTDRTPPEDIQKVVLASAEKTGVWNADLSEIRARIEKFSFVKSAAVSMALPSGIRVNITERVPVAVVKMSFGNCLIDAEGAILAAEKNSDKDFPVVLYGWDEEKTEKAFSENAVRLKLYKKMLDEWRGFDLVSTVKSINLTNVREPVAVVEDSGHSISITLAKDKFGANLKTAIDAISGKGAKIKSVDAGGVYPVIQYLEF